MDFNRPGTYHPPPPLSLAVVWGYFLYPCPLGAGGLFRFPPILHWESVAENTNS